MLPERPEGPRLWPNFGEDGQERRDAQAQKERGSTFPGALVCDVAAGETTFPTILAIESQEAREGGV